MEQVDDLETLDEFDATPAPSNPLKQGSTPSSGASYRTSRADDLAKKSLGMVFDGVSSVKKSLSKQGSFKSRTPSFQKSPGLKRRGTTIFPKAFEEAWGDPVHGKDDDDDDGLIQQKILSIEDLIRTARTDSDKVLSNLHQPFLVHPDGHFRAIWDFVSMVLLSYVAIFTPFQIAFLSREHDFQYPLQWLGFFLIDRFIDLIFVVDIVINFRTPWTNEHGMIMFDCNEAASKYLKGWFFLDVVSVLPFDAIKLIVPNAGVMLKMPRLLKLARLMKLLKVLKASRVVKRLEQNMDVKFGVIRLAKFLVYTTIAAHWLGCLLMLVSETERSDEPGHEFGECDADGNLLTLSWADGLFCSATECTELDHEGNYILTQPGCSKAELYIASIHWSVMTLTTIGYGDISPKSAAEMVFVVFAMLVGAGFFSFVVGTCCSLVEGLDAISIRFQEQLDSINDYMELCKMKPELRARIRKYVWNYKDLSSRKNENDILDLMSPSLKQEVLLNNYGALLRDVPHFAGAPDVFLMNVASNLRTNLFGPRDTITVQGGLSEPFYMLNKGEIVMLRRNLEGSGKVNCGRFKNNGFWNERVLIYDSPADTQVRAVSFVSACACDGEALRSCLKNFPRGYKLCKGLVHTKLMKMAFHSGSIRRAIAKITNDMEDQEAAQRTKERGQTYLARSASRDVFRGSKRQILLGDEADLNYHEGGGLPGLPVVVPGQT